MTTRIPNGGEIRRSVDECTPHEDPTWRPDYTEAEVQGIRRLFEGTADARQQRLVFDYWLRACGKDDRSFRRGGPAAARDGDFAEGKKFMGENLIWMLKSAPTKTDPDKISTRGTEHG